MLKDLLTEEDARELLKEIVGIRPTGQIAINASLYNLKQAGIIRKSEEIKEDQVTEEKAVFILKYADLTQSELNLAISALKADNIIRKSPLQEAREKTDELIDFMQAHSVISLEYNKLKQDIKSEREIVDKKINEITHS
ncbi:MAG: hypothetical protein JXN64_06430 [Spirochaetes bacterium]|nr:hypothetical protein [Spirochaetota bacterium]